MLLDQERQRVEMELERAAEHAVAARERMAWEMEDRQFLDYAGQVLSEANVVGRPEKPLQRALQVSLTLKCVFFFGA